MIFMAWAAIAGYRKTHPKWFLALALCSFAWNAFYLTQNNQWRADAGLRPRTLEEGATATVLYLAICAVIWIAARGIRSLVDQRGRG